MPVPDGLDRHAAAQTFRRLHRDGANGVLTDVLLGFENQVAFSALDHEGVEDLGKCNPLGEANVNDWADDLCNGSLCGHWCGLRVKSKAKIVRSPRKSAPNFAQCECITTHLNFPSHVEGARRTVLTVGTFDGVHAGHRAVLQQLREVAQIRCLHHPAQLPSLTPGPCSTPSTTVWNF